jgi:hypothetical protein
VTATTGRFAAWPFEIIGAELFAAAALAIAPLVAMPFTLVLVSPFMSIGAPAFAALIATMSMAASRFAGGVCDVRTTREWSMARASSAAGRSTLRCTRPTRCAMH